MCLSVWILCGCATPGDKITDDDLREGKYPYVLRAGAAAVGHAPFPAYIPIYLDITDGEKIIDSRLRFKAWDFNHDQRFDMIEVLDRDGKTTAQLFDFNFDGVVDWEKDVEPVGISAASPPEH